MEVAVQHARRTTDPFTWVSVRFHQGWVAAASAATSMCRPCSNMTSVWMS
ncbi:MAG: hypothetical protein ACK4TT_02290 [Phenylobacterium sp.]